MKYQRLSREQFEALHKEFATFLATQSITADQWEMIKTRRPELAEQELDLFSDMIWEGVLKNIEYLEHLSSDRMFLFKAGAEKLHLIVVEVTGGKADLKTVEGLKWLEANLCSEAVNLYTSDKEFGDDKHGELFDLIRKGSDISEGNLYQTFKNLLS